MSDDPVGALLERCCVQIRRGSGVGSGFFIAPNVVITCAHVLGKDAEQGSRVDVRPNGADWLVGVVSAIASHDEDDLAVIEVPFLAGIYPVLDEDDDAAFGDEILIFGYPKYTASGPQRSVPLPARYEGATGLTHVGNRILHKFQSGRVVGGFSGSPALNLMTGKVVGIVSETIDSRAEAGGWAIRASLVAVLFPDVAPSNRRNSRNDLWLQRIDERQDRRESRARRSPRLPLTRYLDRRVSNPEETDYLNPYARVVPLIGRQTERDGVREWLRSEQLTSIAVWIGPAGSGKTRLALEVIEDAIADGWSAGFLEGEQLQRFRQQNLGWTCPRKTFVVIDNAATHALLLRPWFGELADGPAPYSHLVARAPCGHRDGLVADGFSARLGI
ncbi:MAG: Trypsin-like protein serine protease typically periplasmic containing C-terminal domain-like [Candidatus Eremiobacteraeota bacterium]|nr:Trypsin-like protein serine protease typically periplasmic containing C-terminal domain-like [Candidatus Eremiobacteraeota bacterium]